MAGAAREVATVSLALEQEARRLYERYATEVIEAFNLCPWAARARRQGEVATRVLGGASLQPPEPVLRSIEELAEQGSVAVALLIVPRFRGTRSDWEHAVAALRKRYEDGKSRANIAFAMAAFHPQAAPDRSTPERLVPFIRRSPDPTIQLVRHRVLERVKRGQQGTAFVDPARLVTMLASGELAALAAPSTSERVAAANLATVEQAGLERIETIFDDIQADRQRSYARLGERMGDAL